MKKDVLVYIVLDLLCTGVGMGVPVCNILLGFLVGWYAATRPKLKNPLQYLFKTAVFTSLFTFLLMAIIWLPHLSDTIETFGVPLILYTPVASFYGWMVLMVIISPFLQVLTTVFAGTLAMSYATKRRKV